MAARSSRASHDCAQTAISKTTNKQLYWQWRTSSSSFSRVAVTLEVAVGGRPPHVHHCAFYRPRPRVRELEESVISRHCHLQLPWRSSLERRDNRMMRNRNCHRPQMVDGDGWWFSDRSWFISSVSNIFMFVLVFRRVACLGETSISEFLV